MLHCLAVNSGVVGVNTYSEVVAGIKWSDRPNAVSLIHKAASRPYTLTKISKPMSGIIAILFIPILQAPSYIANRLALH